MWNFVQFRTEYGRDGRTVVEKTYGFPCLSESDTEYIDAFLLFDDR